MFTDRTQAGRELAIVLHDRGYDNPVVLALPRGGVPLAREVARALKADLDVLIVRKLGVPSNPEFAFGALGEGGAIVLDEQTMADLHIDRRTCDRWLALAPMPRLAELPARNHSSEEPASDKPTVGSLRS